MADRLINRPANNIAHQDPAIQGGLGEDGNWYYQGVDKSGNASVTISPFLDVDTTYVWNLDGTPQQIIETSATQTKTTVFTWNPDGSLASESVVIT